MSYNYEDTITTDYDYYADILREEHNGEEITILDYVDDTYETGWDVAVIYQVEDTYYLSDESGNGKHEYGEDAEYGDLYRFEARDELLSFLRESTVPKMSVLYQRFRQTLSE